MKKLSSSIRRLSDHSPKHITTKDPEFEELRAVYFSYAHECREVKLLAKRLQDDIRIMAKAYVDFGMELERYFLATGDQMGPLYRSFTFLLRDQFRAVELGLGDTISAMELGANVNEGLRTRIAHRDDVRSHMDKYWKYRERGHRDEQRYMDYVKQFEEVNTLLKMEMRTLRESQWRFKDVHLRKLVQLQRDAFNLLAMGSLELEQGLNLRPASFALGAPSQFGGQQVGVGGISASQQFGGAGVNGGYGGQQYGGQQYGGQQYGGPQYGSGQPIGGPQQRWSVGPGVVQTPLQSQQQPVIGQREPINAAQPPLSVEQQQFGQQQRMPLGGLQAGEGGDRIEDHMGSIPLLSRYLATGALETVGGRPMGTAADLESGVSGSSGAGVAAPVVQPLYPSRGGGFVPPTTIPGSTSAGSNLQPGSFGPSLSSDLVPPPSKAGVSGEEEVSPLRPPVGEETQQTFAVPETGGHDIVPSADESWKHPSTTTQETDDSWQRQERTEQGMTVGGGGGDFGPSGLSKPGRYPSSSETTSPVPFLPGMERMPVFTAAQRSRPVQSHGGEATSGGTTAAQ